MIKSNKPKFAEVNGKKYTINTDFRVAVECDSISKKKDIGEYEKSLAIIYKLFGDEGIDNEKDYEKLLKIAVKFLNCGKDIKEISSKNNKQKVNMDYLQDRDYINASFMSDYGIDLEEKEMHWWTYFNLLNGLTENCVLNRVRGIRDFDIDDIKDSKEKAKMIEQQSSVALIKDIEPKEKLNDKEKESVNKFYKLTGIKK